MRAARTVRLGAALALALAGSAVAARSEASPVETFGFGSRSAAMGNAVTADATDFSANYYNPAGLVGQKRLLIELGYVRAHHALEIDGKDNHVDELRAMTIGLVAPGEVAKVPFAFGLGIHLPDARVFRVRSMEQQQPRWELYDNRTQRIFFAANLAVKPARWLEIGGGLSFLATTRAALDVSGAIATGDVNQSALRHQVDADLRSIRYPQIGVRLLPTERLRFGAVYRGEFQLDLDVDANVAAKFAGLPLTSVITTRSVNAFLPQQIAVGCSWDPIDSLTVDVDVTWVDWSAYKSPVTRVTADTRIEGAPPGLIPEKAAPTDVKPMNFHDRFVPRVGVEWRAPLGPKERGHRLALRAGYSYERTPIPEQRSLTNYVDADRHAIGAGVGLSLHHLVEELPGDLRLDVHAQLSILPETPTRKESAADFVGDYRQRGRILSLGTTLGVAF